MELKVLNWRKSKGQKSFILNDESEFGLTIIAIKLDGSKERFQNVSRIRWEWEGERVDLHSDLWGCGCGRNFKKGYKQVMVTKAKGKVNSFEELLFGDIEPVDSQK